METIHRYQDKLNKDINVLFLMIPILAFGLILGFYLINVKAEDNYLATESAPYLTQDTEQIPNVLGEKDQLLDNPDNYVENELE